MYDLVIIGAGPSGLEAAIQASKQGVKTLIIDEFYRAGGRLLGQLHQEPNGEWVNGLAIAEDLINEAKAYNIQFKLEASVVHLEKSDNGWIIYTNKGVYKTKALLLATGATEKTIALPGNTLPGVISIGAAQVLGNVNRVLPGKRGIIIGVNPLTMAIARELQLCGGNLEGIYLPPKNTINKQDSQPLEIMQRMMGLGNLAPSMLMRIGSKFVPPKLAIQFYPKNGMKVWGIPIYMRKVVTRIIGKTQVEAVEVQHVDIEGNAIGNPEFVPVDFVCLSGGLRPLIELAELAGCDVLHKEALSGAVPLHSESMETKQSGLFLSGNITGVESAKVARAQGKVAGQAIVNYLQPAIDPNKELLNRLAVGVKKARQEALIQFKPNIEQVRSTVYHQYKHG